MDKYNNEDGTCDHNFFTVLITLYTVTRTHYQTTALILQLVTAAHHNVLNLRVIFVFINIFDSAPEDFKATD